MSLFYCLKSMMSIFAAQVLKYSRSFPFLWKCDSCKSPEEIDPAMVHETRSISYWDTDYFNSNLPALTKFNDEIVPSNYQWSKLYNAYGVKIWLNARSLLQGTALAPKRKSYRIGLSLRLLQSVFCNGLESDRSLCYSFLRPGSRFSKVPVTF